MNSRIPIDSDLEIFKRAFSHENWREVVNMYKEKKELRTASVFRNGRTALHEAAIWEYADAVESMVDIVMKEDENEYDKNLVLAAKDDDGETPLHLAVGWTRNIKMCEKISGADPLLIAKRNNAGETPLFSAVRSCKKRAFLLLHHQYMSSSPAAPDVVQSITRDDQDNILHIALEEKFIDLALEIVLLYRGYPMKEMTRMRNRNGLSPLHLLAESPDLFQSTDLFEQSFIVRLLYHCLTFVRVRKEKATTRDELEQDDEHKRLQELVDSFYYFIDDSICALEELCGSWCEWTVRYITRFLFILSVMIPLGLPLIAEHWLHKMRGMKEKHIWSLQILEELLRRASDEDMDENPYEEEKGEGSKIVDTPLMIAAKNGITEIVDNILNNILIGYWCPIYVVNEEGKNVVLLSIEQRQIKVYQICCKYKEVFQKAFEQVDKEGNTALHLAAKPGVNLNWQTTTMIEEHKWFEFVKNSVPSELREKNNNDGKTADEIFKENYKEHITNDRQWLIQTSQTCSVASTLIASMAFSNIMADKYKENNYSTIVALSLSLTSTICFLAILSFRSQSLNFWRYAPFILQLAILTMFGSIIALWISLMFDGKALKVYAILGSPIAIFTIVSLPIFIGPALVSMFAKVPPPNRNASTSAIRYRKKKKPAPTANDPLQDIVTSLKNFMLTNVPPPNHNTAPSVIDNLRNAGPTPTSINSLLDNGSNIAVPPG